MKTMEMWIDEVAHHAAKLTRQEYNEKKYDEILCYDLARDAARDRGLALRPNVDVDYTPDNVGSALLKMFDDIREEQGLPRQYADCYKPRIYVN